jgi:sulfonate transport system substrate-binding protein
MARRRLVLFAVGVTLAWSWASASAQTTVRYSMYSPPGLPSIQDHIAMQKGYFDQEGIKIQGVTVQVGAQVIQLLETGELDVANTAIVPWLLGAAKGVPYRLVMSAAKGNSAMVVRRDVGSIKELNGKAVGTPGAGSQFAAHLRYVEKRDGVKFEYMHGQGMAQVLQLFQRGEIVAFSGWEPFPAIAVQTMGAKYIQDFVRPDAMESVQFAVADRFAKQNPQVAVKFLRAVLKSVMLMEQKPDEANRIIADALKVAPDVVKVAREHVLLTKPIHDRPGIRTYLDEMIADGRIAPTAVPDRAAFVERLVDESYLHTAMDQLKREGWRP